MSVERLHGRWVSLGLAASGGAAGQVRRGAGGARGRAALRPHAAPARSRAPLCPTLPQSLIPGPQLAETLSEGRPGWPGAQPCGATGSLPLPAHSHLIPERPDGCQVPLGADLALFAIMSSTPLDPPAPPPPHPRPPTTFLALGRQAVHPPLASPRRPPQPSHEPRAGPTSCLQRDLTYLYMSICISPSPERPDGRQGRPGAYRHHVQRQRLPAGGQGGGHGQARRRAVEEVRGGQGERARAACPFLGDCWF